MRMFSWRHLWQRSSVPSDRRTPPRYHPRVRQFESRELLSTFTVVLATDSGGASGQMVSPTSGDLRYCIEQADATHTATSDVINFDATVFATPQTILLNSANGPLTLSDSHPLIMQGPAGGTATISGDDAIAVLNVESGTVSMSNLTVSHAQTATSGAGLTNGGNLTLTNCNFDHDVAANGGGGGFYNAAGVAKLVGCTFNHDSAFDGGGIFDFGKLTLAKCTFSNDVSTGVGGGGVWVSNDSKVTMTSTVFNNDSTDEDGGAVFVTGGTTVLTLTSCTLSNGFAGNGGGGLCTDGPCTVKMTRCNISNNAAGNVGGGVCNVDSTVGLTNCTLSNDSVLVSSGGGGGLANDDGGTATVVGCTFNNDSAAVGGGMDNDGPATLINCTFSNNFATVNSSFGGAGIYSSGGFTISLTNCTLANNTSNGFGGGIWNAADSTLNLTNTIVAENSAASGPDIYGSINTADHNLIGDATGSTIITDMGGNLLGGNGDPVIDPRLGPLQNNGGPTQTLALLADSLAIGHADDAFAPTTDQRGHMRTDHFGLATDIGACEYP